jgi:adenosylhomocysteine nucleosidase
MKKIIILAALKSEFVNEKDFSHEIKYTGVGKINATRSTTQLILEEKPELIVNVGTAGALLKSMSGIYIVNEVIEHDMNAEPLSRRGMVPFDNSESIYKSDIGDTKCATGDSFVTTIDPWLLNENVSLVDMELFAIAKVCNHYGIPWRSMKFVSDYADDNSGRSWEDSLHKSNLEINDAIQKLLG